MCLWLLDLMKTCGTRAASVPLLKGLCPGKALNQEGWRLEAVCHTATPPSLSSLPWVPDRGSLVRTSLPLSPVSPLLGPTVGTTSKDIPPSLSCLHLSSVPGRGPLVRTSLNVSPLSPQLGPREDTASNDIPPSLSCLHISWVPPLGL